MKTNLKSNGFENFDDKGCIIGGVPDLATYYLPAMKKLLVENGCLRVFYTKDFDVSDYVKVGVIYYPKDKFEDIRKQQSIILDNAKKHDIDTNGVDGIVYRELVNNCIMLNGDFDKIVNILSESYSDYFTVNIELVKKVFNDNYDKLLETI